MMMMMMIFIQAMHGIPYEPSLSAALPYNERRLYLMIREISQIRRKLGGPLPRVGRFPGNYVI